MTHPTFDSNGYPTEETLAAIRDWPANDLHGLFRFVGEAWYYPNYWHQDGDTYTFATGGWSGNEDLIDALEVNRIAWAVCWQSSARGGRYVFEVREVRRG